MLMQRIVCLGISPLLFKRMSQEFKMRENKSETTPRLTGGDIASAHLYRDGEGRVVLPTPMLKTRLLAACNGNRDRQSFVEQFTIQEDYIPLIDPKNNQAATWKVYRSSIIEEDKPSLEIIRPQIDRWSFSTLINVHTIDIQTAKHRLQAVFEKAGTRVRLGWQPVKEETYGQFTVYSIEQEEVVEA